MSETDVSNPPYQPPMGLADAPPAVPPEAAPDPETQAYLESFEQPPDPRDPDQDPNIPPEDYQEGFVKPPDPRDPTGEAADAPPAVVMTPYAEQRNDLLNCTMGEWLGEPTAYAYQWLSDGTTVVDEAGADHVVTPEDVGHTLSCVVTATNAFGATAADPSNGVMVAEPVTARSASNDAVREENHHRGHRRKGQEHD